MTSDFFESCDRYVKTFCTFGFMVLSGPLGAKSWVIGLLAVLSAGNVSRPSSGRVAQHPALSVSVSSIDF
jgi:hypothetical protein